MHTKEWGEQLAQKSHQRKKTYAVAQVLDQVLNLEAPDVYLCVEPFCECLLLDGDPVLLLSKGHLG